MWLWWPPRQIGWGLRTFWARSPGGLCFERVPLAAVLEACWEAVVGLDVCRQSPLSRGPGEVRGAMRMELPGKQAWWAGIVMQG